MSDAVDAITVLNDRYSALSNAGDLNGWIELFMDDAIYPAPDMSAHLGKEAIRAYARDAFFDPLPVQLEAPLARPSGDVTSTDQAHDGDRPQVSTETTSLSGLRETGPKRPRG